MTETLDPELLAPIEKVARFIESGDVSLLSAFASRGVVILENFAPHLFEGEDAVARWSQKILAWHVPGDLVLKHRFGPPQDLRVQDELAFVSLPTHWSILQAGDRTEEDGGWAFVLVKEDGAWRVRGYGWAVTYIGE